MLKLKVQARDALELAFDAFFFAEPDRARTHPAQKPLGKLKRASIPKMPRGIELRTKSALAFFRSLLAR